MSDILDDTNKAQERNAAKPTIWRSLAEFHGQDPANPSSANQAPGETQASGLDADVANFVGREFPTDDFDQLDGVDRRRFFQILGASAALAGASSCRWERETILPYNERPEETVPGKPKYYASVLDLAGAARPVSVTSFDGRPVKVEPNTLVGHGTDVFSQAAVLGFYDPDRSRRVMRRVPSSDGAPSTVRATWDEAMTTLKAASSADGFAVLASTHSSPTLARLGAEMGARWVWWSPVSQDNVHRGAELAFGRNLRTRYDLANADVVVSLDCDFQRSHPDSVRMAADFATRRMPEEGGDTRPMARLYAIESRFTSTGVTADHRLPVRSADTGAILELLEAELGRGTAGARAQELAGNPKVKAFVAAAAKDLQAAGAHGVVIPGAGQPAEVHARVHGLNAAIGAVGTTVAMADEPMAGGQDAALATLVADMNSGAVKTLLILEGNPAYDAPADLDFAGAMAKCTTAHLSLYRDETSALADWHMPAAHWLEAWGDARSWDGSLHLAQPLIRPLHGGRSTVEVCATLLGRPGDGRDEVRATFDALGLSGSGEARYRQALHDGVVEGTRSAAVSVTPNADLPRIPATSPGTEVTFFPCPKVFDGRFANNGWLQELPDFTTKMTWDNAVLVGVKTANAMDVDTGDMVKVTVGGRELEAAAYVAPGQAEDSIAIALGYGRTHAGLVAGSAKVKVDAAGFNAYRLRGTDGMAMSTAASIAKSRGSYSFATTQEHHLIDEIGMQGRRERLHKLAMEGTLEEWKEDPNFPESVYHVPKLESLFDKKVYTGEHQWGMTIDLSTCNGCNACVIACQSENNIPIVGKEQVKRGREMHWMRVDLYYQGDAEDADTVDAVNQPINCLQCENAPCEQVCPVAATVHSDEGTNDMVYNRCIGTRYCGNNCPVKVRRFNYFHYTKYMDKPEHKLLQLGQNPNVTVRSRGVMEKCTYCQQRISEARIAARNEDRKIRDGEVITACQAACPPQAITFGDLTDKESRVSKKQALGRDYSMLAELNIKPRTQYLARITNPNPELASVMPQGVTAREDYEETKAIYARTEHHGDQGSHGADDHSGDHAGDQKEGAGHDDH